MITSGERRPDKDKYSKGIHKCQHIVKSYTENTIYSGLLYKKVATIVYYDGK